MISSDLSYDLIPGIDQQAYAAWARKVIGTLLKQPGIVEFRANRNILGSPQVRATSVWQTLADWARFAENVWPPLEAELRTFAIDIRMELWGPSPVVPEPLRPSS